MNRLPRCERSTRRLSSTTPASVLGRRLSASLPMAAAVWPRCGASLLHTRIEMDDPVVNCAGGLGALPEYQSDGASGADVRALLPRDIVLKPGQRALIPTGLHLEIPRGL